MLVVLVVDLIQKRRSCAFSFSAFLPSELCVAQNETPTLAANAEMISGKNAALNAFQIKSPFRMMSCGVIVCTGPDCSGRLVAGWSVRAMAIGA